MDYKNITTTIKTENDAYGWEWRYNVVGSTVMIEDLTVPRIYKNISTCISSLKP